LQAFQLFQSLRWREDLEPSDTRKRLPPEPVEIRTWSNLVYELSRFQNGVWVFRGVGSEKFELKPKIGRREYVSTMQDKQDKITFPELEQRIFKQFRARAIPHVKGKPTEWEWLVIAQHHGLPTRLLDWTRNPFAAAFFALSDLDNNDHEIDDPLHDSDLIEEESATQTINEDNASPFERENCAVIYAWYAHAVLNVRTTPCPFRDYSEIMLLNPPHVDQRIIAQDGVFAAFPNPKIALDKNETRRLLIQKKDKAIFLKRLFRMGIHNARLFPDLDGISTHLGWRLRNYIGIGGQTL
jgi:hypothetical protein